ncbi:putative RNA-directed DNA polymerase [Aphis craccivora]|uniref:Putative RNA-directed DNA polymerase n=1 Tax=Aphis craccivora TaxID=307492 RepID=A0A6G0Z332_APHCR|nr:putative RNA-directed DNA polymerase [Aphis craccivora]
MTCTISHKFDKPTARLCTMHTNTFIFIHDMYYLPFILAYNLLVLDSKLDLVFNRTNNKSTESHRLNNNLIRKALDLLVNNLYRIFFINAYKLNIFCPPHDYSPIQCLFSLESINYRRHSANISFLSNLLSSKIDSPESLSRISFNVPSRRTRSFVPFHIPFSSSNFHFSSPIIRLMRFVPTQLLN